MDEWPGQGGGCGECERVHRYTMSKQSGCTHRHSPKISVMARVGTPPPRMASTVSAPVFMLMLSLRQGLTIVHFSAQLKHFLWDAGGLTGINSSG